MARMAEYDGEIGRGRLRSANGSSSSRESSQERPAPKRIPSPAISDDGDTRMQAVADDDTPPPAARPLIRQAVAFSSNQPPQSIVTYEAVPETVPKPGFFLPGQEVPIPPKPKPEKPKKPAKRPRRPEAYPGQTSRFRIQTYDPTPSADPPLDHGPGPYSSMYRGVAAAAKGTGRQDSPTVSISSNGGYPSSSTASSNTPSTLRKTSSDSRNSVSSRPPPPPPPPPPPSRSRAQPEKSRQPQSSYNEGHRQTSQRGAHHSQQPPPSNHSYQAPNSSASSSSYHASASSAAGAPYYRRDYDSQPTDRMDSMSPPREQQYRARGHQQASGGTASHFNGSGQSSESPSQKRSKQPLRMVTILIQDLRSGTVDHQLAEVKVPLRPGDDPEDGFWADAMDLTQELQTGLSRIDGPARAYTLRGKYRQFILRVSADNVDEFMSANVVIQPDRTLDLVVEMLPPHGAAPPPPKIPSELLTPAYDEYDAHSDRMDVVDSRRGSSETQRDPRKRAKSPSFDDYDSAGPTAQPHPVLNKVPRHDYAWQQSPMHSPRHTSPHYPGHSSTEASGSSTSKRKRNSIKEVHQLQYTFPDPPPLSPPRPPRSPSPTQGPLHAPRPDQSDDDGEESVPPDEPFIRAVDRLLQEDPSWSEFYKAQAGKKILDVVKQYEFIRQKCKALRGKPVPGFTQLIEDIHIVRALQVEDRDYLKNCNETMDLLNLYGKQGRHYEDPRVTDLINDPTPLKHGSNPYKRILHLLQEIDEAWKNGETEPSRQRLQHHSPSAAPSGPESPLADSSHHASRNTKGMFVQ
ncbi:hypothetical protein BDZ97DRAFT_1801527 [Flammula alnicola]|nr:hypothetical protein BDZ97DRAFT_1801527 [Flammula alnicola]